MKFRSGVTAALAVGALGVAGTAVAVADQQGDKIRQNRQAIDTEADYTPFERFTPLAGSSPCVGEVSGRQAKPFVIPPEYQQQVVAEEGDPGLNQNSDNWDMNTQNEFGKDAGRYVYRPHENRDARAGQVSLTDLKTGRSSILAERADWEAFDGIVWTPQGTILANEEVTKQAKPDPNVPQASGGLVYELFVDQNDPSKLDPSREPITPGDGTNDTTRDGIRARPALGAKAHEGMRFDKRGFMYGIAESRGQSSAGAAGAIFRFIPDLKGDLSRGRLQALVTENRRTGEGRWVDLDRTQVQIDADAEAERKGANEYQRPEDLETGESTGKDRNNGGNTVYVSLTEGAEEGVLAIDVSAKDRPFAYPYVGTFAGNNPGGFNSPDNLALDARGNLAIAEDPPANPVGADVFVAAPPRGNGDAGKRRQPARTVQRFSSLKDCAAETSGIYFALKGTERFSREIGLDNVVNGETLFAHRQHAGQSSPIDELVAIAPANGDDHRPGRGDDDQGRRANGQGQDQNGRDDRGKEKGRDGE